MNKGFCTILVWMFYMDEYLVSKNGNGKRTNMRYLTVKSSLQECDKIAFYVDFEEILPLERATVSCVSCVRGTLYLEGVSFYGIAVLEKDIETFKVVLKS